MNEQSLSSDTADSISEINKGELNRLARNATFYNSYEQLSFVEHDEIRGEKLHIVVVRNNLGCVAKKKAALLKCEEKKSKRSVMVLSELRTQK